MSDLPPANEPRREREVIVTNGGGGGGGAVAAVVGVIVLLIVLFFLFGRGLFTGDDTGDDTTIEAPDVEAPDELDVEVEDSTDGDGGGTEETTDGG